MVAKPRLLVPLAAAVLAWGVLPTTAIGRSSRPRDQLKIAHQPAINTRLSGAVLLAPGAGYPGVGRSALVRALQRRLAQLGDRPGPIDGRYGPLTERAVARFQAAHGLRIDGIAGPQTLAALTAPIPVLYPGAGFQQPRGSTSVRALQRRLAGLG